MKTLTRIFGAGESVTWQIPGNELRLIQCPNAVDVVMIRDGVELDERSTGVDVGFWAKPRGGFEAFKITSATVQTVRIGVSSYEAGLDKAFGLVEVSNTVANPVPVLLEDDATSAQFSNLFSTAYTAGAADPIVLPGTNVNGVILRHAEIQYSPGADGTLAIVARTTAPTAITNGTCPLFVHQAVSTPRAHVQLLRPVLLPPGVGAWFIGDQNGSYRANFAIQIL
jgi:hypothetical protein